MASKFINVMVLTVVLFFILGSNTLVMTHGDAGAAVRGGVAAGAALAGAVDGAATAGGAAPAGAATGGAVAGAPGAATFADQSGVMDAGVAGLGARAPARRR